jgi:hypothetical protein
MAGKERYWLSRLVLRRPSPTLLSRHSFNWHDRPDVQRTSRIAASTSLTLFESKCSLCIVVIDDDRDLNSERDERCTWVR